VREDSGNSAMNIMVGIKYTHFCFELRKMVKAEKMYLGDCQVTML